MTDKETRERELLELITDAENLATVHAKEYCDTYNSFHEAYSYCKEEVQESTSENDKMQTMIGEAWRSIRDDRDSKPYFKGVKEYAQKGIVELLHVIAVCNKIEGM